ncbi:MAG: hypothetical protein MUE95_04970 [Cyclobacteriaceae bacterium]|nr:hypothetical protein [Cyclobacteriaceae bacterium]
MRYVPSPVPLPATCVYRAQSNASGRMQYYKILPGKGKLRITRTEFIRAYNETSILALQPLQNRGSEIDFQIEFYV